MRDATPHNPAVTVPLVIVMPVFEDRASARRLLSELIACCPISPYVIAVEDGSVSDPLRIDDVLEAGVTGEIVTLTRNMGHQRAIAVGLAYAAEHLAPAAVVVMDADGEDRPRGIPALLAKLREPGVDAVVARRRKRSESLRFRVYYAVYRVFFHALTGRSIGFGNFSALTGPAVTRLAAMQEVWVHYAASLMISKLRIAAVPIDRGRRYAGRPHMNFTALTLHGLRSIMVFAEDVLVRIGVSCVFLMLAAVVLLVVAVILKLAGHATPGWFTSAMGILCIIFMQAGVLTFVTLMVSGLVRSTPPMTRAHVEQLIARIEKTPLPGPSGLPLPAPAAGVPVA